MNITQIQTIVTYDLETWSFRKTEETRLKVYREENPTENLRPMR